MTAPTKYSKEDAISLYHSFDALYKTRAEAFSDILRPYIEVVNDYGELFSRISYITGFKPPKSNIESIQRNLSADSFDLLNETKYLILRGHVETAFPVARRSFETLTLMIAFHFDNKLAEKWHNGGQIPNRKVRDVLDENKEIGGEDKETMKELYKYFSKSSHPNKSSIPHRYIGLGNYYALGPYPEPSLLSIVDLCIEIINLWFWLLAYAWYDNLAYVNEFDVSFKDEYLEKKNKVLEVKKWLIDQRKNLINELNIKMDK